ncbi:hypothetical protein [Streptomyces halobius]|uniref:DUF1990 domain-containing protein n=1 Tax=Streptomyces halobius TaxID=2879846 RepID=A0ABY4MIJ4_9ACTN|nr:hypothetical protein [Streptomyces halobius]UQA97177.1 hypothetical protein K9S39_39680 [Streptomyces halobius]
MNVEAGTDRGAGAESAVEGTAAPTAHQQSDVPEVIRSLSAMADPDYADCFTLTTSDATDWSAEQWARATFEDAAGELGQQTWRERLGLRLRPLGATDTVAGWQIGERGDNWIRLEANSGAMTTRLVFHVGDGQASFATFIRYDEPAGERVWTAATATHQGAVPGLMRQGCNVLRSRPR